MTLHWSSFPEFNEMISGVGQVFKDLQIPTITTHFMAWFQLISNKVLNILPELLLLVANTKQFWMTTAVLLLLLWLFTNVYQIAVNCVKGNHSPVHVA